MVIEAPDARRRRLVVSPAEHHAVLDSVEWLVKHDGAEVTWLPVEPSGRVLPEAAQGPQVLLAAPGADMAVAVVNDGPVTIWMDTADRQG